MKVIYSPIINESNYYLPIQDSTNEKASQAHESKNSPIRGNEQIYAGSMIAVLGWMRVMVAVDYE